MDLTPVSPAGRQILESYGGGRFRVSGTLYGGSVLVFPEQTLDWPVGDFNDITLDSLEPVLERGGRSVDVLLLGCGASMALIPAALRSAVRERGVVIEPMDTGAACRTYNVLMAEERHVAAALIATD